MKRRILVLVAGFAALLPFVLLPTTASWTDDAHFTTEVSAGTWVEEPTGPVNPGNPDTAMTDITWTLVTNNPIQVCFVASVTTTSPSPVTWRLDLDLAQPPFNGVTSGFQIDNAPGGESIGWKLRIAYDLGAMVASVTGTGDVAQVSAGQTLRFQVCNHSLPPGVQTPDAYTVQITQGTWTDALACQTATVTGNGKSQFFFAWETELDMTAAVARLSGSSFGFTNPTGNLHQLTRTVLRPNVFHLSSNTAANLADTGQYVFTYCATRW